MITPYSFFVRAGDFGEKANLPVHPAKKKRLQGPLTLTTANFSLQGHARDVC